MQAHVEKDVKKKKTLLCTTFFPILLSFLNDGMRNNSRGRVCACVRENNRKQKRKKRRDGCEMTIIRDNEEQQRSSSKQKQERKQTHMRIRKSKTSKQGPPHREIEDHRIQGACPP